MTYPELLIALDIGDPETVLSNTGFKPTFANPSLLYYIVCDDGDCHAFDKNGIEHKIDYIPKYCFSFTGNSYLKKIIIPKTAKSIGNWAFSYCSSLTSVTISSNVTSIGYGAFWDCSKLTSVTIGNSVTSIENHAFYSCNSLKSMVFEGKTMKQIKAMDNYPWEIEDVHIIQAGL